MKSTFLYLMAATLLAYLPMTSSAAPAPYCGMHVTGDITFNADLHCDSSSGTYAALFVSSPNITIDLNGYRLSGTIEVGIDVYATTGGPAGHNLTVKNGSIAGFNFGIRAFKANDMIVDQVKFDELSVGVSIGNAKYGLISNSKFLRSIQGISLYGYLDGHIAQHHQVVKNEFSEIAYAALSIHGYLADYNQIIDNEFNENGYDIYIYGGSYNHIESNRSYGNIDSSVRIVNGYGNEIVSNGFYKGRAGIEIYAEASSYIPQSSPISKANIVYGNHIVGHITGVFLGYGIDKTIDVYANTVDYNKIYDCDTGIIAGSDTGYNDLAGNAYQGTSTPYIDNGVNNSF